MNALQALVRERMEELKWSAGKVAAEGGLPRSTVYNLLRAEMRDPPSIKTMEGLARGLRCSEEAVRQAVAKTVGLLLYDESDEDTDTTIIITTSRRLSPERRRELRRMAEIMLDSEEGKDS
jgi:transcriptional regulator with XRE-family HTH domain